MDKALEKSAAEENRSMFDAMHRRDYIDGTPHVKHECLKELYRSLVRGVYDRAHSYKEVPRVLDLGAGEGSATIAFLRSGCHVTAVDISVNQLRSLESECADHAGRLEIVCADVTDVLNMFKKTGKLFDIVVTNAFLHHVPDYTNFVKNMLELVEGNGQFFSFQDPMLYRSLTPFAKIFNLVSYASWRIFKGDIMGGIKRRMRRSKGVYVEQEDNAEYHVARAGVDQDAICGLFRELGWEYKIIYYFSTQNGIFQNIGSALNIKNEFSIIARRP